MDLYTIQVIFYSLAIVFMIALIALVIVLIYVLFQMKAAVDKGVQFAQDTVEDVKRHTVDKVESIISDNRTKIFSSLAMGGATYFLNRLKNGIFSKKKKSSSSE